jgi:ribonuclease HI
MVEVFVDGACSGNPGPMGIGCVFVKNKVKKMEHCEAIGDGTNNVAELSAIEFAIDECLRRNGTRRQIKEHLIIYSDSTYSVNSLIGRWNGHKNQNQIRRIKSKMKRFKRLHLMYIPRCSVPYHKLADSLAKSGVQNGVTGFPEGHGFKSRIGREATDNKKNTEKGES